MLSRVQKWGNTLAVRIPQTFAEQAGLSSDTSVELTLVNGKIVIGPAPSDDRLAILLDAITPENIHGEMDSGDAVGNETW